MDYLHRLFQKRVPRGNVVLLAMALLLTGCLGGGGNDDGATSPPPPPPPPPPPAPSGSVTVSGTVAYEFVPPNLNCRGLDFGSTVVRPIRGATVQLVDLSNRELGRTASGDDGSYSFAEIEPELDVRIRVRAELKKTGSPGWDVEVRDNVVTDPNPPALSDRPLYAIVSDFNTGTTADLTRNLTARTGWDASAGAYTRTRAAAPFAVLDSIYTAMQLILSVEPNAAFSPLDAYWSVNNTRTGSTSFDIDSGELGASFYTPDPDRNGIANPSLFLLGDAAVDTEEFDDHVIVHEWGHYFEDNFARSDSTGGRHGIGDRLDARLAFGEGWATAFSGIALENPLYCDTGAAGSTAALLPLGLEDGGYDPRGWYDEVSVLRFIYDLWDTTDDEGPGEGTDGGSIGFAPIYETMVGPQAFTETFTTVFSFASELRAMLPPEDQAFLDSQLVREDMTPGFDKWGVGELNDASPDGQQSRDVLPLYVDMPMDGTVVNICSNDDYDGAGDGNKLATYRFLRLDVPTTSAYLVNVIATTADTIPGEDDPDDPRDRSDPDMYILLDGRIVDSGTSGNADEEIFRTTTLTGPDTYVADLREFRYADPDSPIDFPNRMCFDVSFTPTP